MAKRLRIFAGPNGSGKSTFIKDFPSTSSLKLGYYVNADDIEQQLKRTASLSVKDFSLKVDTEDIQLYFKNSQFAPVKLRNGDIWKYFSIENDEVRIDQGLSINSYLAADLAEFIRQGLLKEGHSFSFETVMSDHKKIEFLRYAKAQGYRIYLYYFATKDPLININRVDLRVIQNGHAVKAEIIENRYYRSLENLKDVLISDRAYLFDNSGAASVLIAEVESGKNVHVIDPEGVPNWFMKYLADKN